MSARYEVVKGDDVVFNFTVKDRGLSAIDLTEATEIKFQVKATVGGSALISKTLGSGVTVTDADAGKFSVAVTDTDTGALSAGDYIFEAQVTDSDGLISTVRGYNNDYGTLVILDQIIT